MPRPRRKPTQQGRKPPQPTRKPGQQGRGSGPPGRRRQRRGPGQQRRKPPTQQGRRAGQGAPPSHAEQLARKLSGLHLGRVFDLCIPRPQALSGFPGKLSSEVYMDPGVWDRLDYLVIRGGVAPVYLKAKKTETPDFRYGMYHLRSFWGGNERLPPGSEASPLCVVDAVAGACGACGACARGEPHGLAETASASYCLANPASLGRLDDHDIRPTRYFLSLPPKIAVLPQVQTAAGQLNPFTIHAGWNGKEEAPLPLQWLKVAMHMPRVHSQLSRDATELRRFLEKVRPQLTPEIAKFFAAAPKTSAAAPKTSAAPARLRAAPAGGGGAK